VSIAARSALLSDFSAALSGEVARHERTVEEGGEALWLQSTVAPILVEGSVVGVLGAEVDVTKLKRAEESLAALNAGLESKVAERTAQLQDMIHELRDAQDRLVLSEKLAVIGRLAASIAHELNSPLGPSSRPARPSS
jgi:C4-dicarboxylate-specific signal transduction histidine kinase